MYVAADKDIFFKNNIRIKSKLTVYENKIQG